MKINTNNNVNFKGVNLIQVSKKAFVNPNDYVEVGNTFVKKANKITGEVNANISTFFTILGLGKYFNKTHDILEQPQFPHIMDKINKNGGYSIQWASLHTNLPIKQPLSEDYHSFFVYTKEHKDKTLKLFSFKNSLKIYNQMEKEKVVNKSSEKNRDLWATIRINNIMTEKFEEIAKGANIKKFVIEDLSELPDVFKKIDY